MVLGRWKACSQRLLFWLLFQPFLLGLLFQPLLLGLLASYLDNFGYIPCFLDMRMELEAFTCGCSHKKSLYLLIPKFVFMTVFASQVRVGRLDNVHCCFGGGGRGAASLLLVFTLLGCNVGAAKSLSPDGQALLKFLEDNLYVVDPRSGFASWNASDDTPCEWLRVVCGPDSAVRRLDLSESCLDLPMTDAGPPELNLNQLRYIESLEELDLSSIPQAITSISYFLPLARLIWLDLSGSFLYVNSDEVHSLALPSLQYLNAEGSASSEVLIEALHGLRELVAFSLANNGLRDLIPEDVRYLTQLKSLDLSGNSFDGSIPSLEGLTRLVQLSVARNNLSGDVPTAPSVQYVDAAENSFTDLTDSFFQNSALKQVNFSRNQLVGQLPGNIGGLEFLEVLDLSWNGLQGQIPSGLGNVTQLDLSHNNLSGPIPLDIRPTSGPFALSWLDLSGNALNGSIPASVVYEMSYVNLSGNFLVGNLPSSYDGQPTLSGRLDLSDNQLDGPLPNSFTESTVPEQLWLRNNNLSGDFTDFLTQPIFQNEFVPKSIRVQGNSFTGDLTKLLGSGILMEPLVEVWDLSHNRFNMTPSEEFPNPLQNTLERFCTLEISSQYNARPLQEFRLAGSDLMGQTLPVKLNCTGGLDSLQILDLASCNLTGTVPDSAFFNMSMPHLTFLNVSNNGLSGPIPNGLPDTLQVLDVANNNLVFEREMASELFTGLRSLERFYASNNNLSGPIPGTFPPTLRVLDLSHNNLTGAIPGNLFFALLHLEYINLSGNDLSGTIPDDLNLTVFKTSSFADNPGLCGGPLPDCVIPQPPRQGAGRINVLLLVTVVVAAVLVSTASCLLLVWRWRVYSRKHQQDADLIATLLERGAVTVMPLRHLRRATSNFSESAQIGVGGFGTVYTGKLADGTQVAIKKGKREDSPEYKQQFLNEVRILSGVKHRHLVKLLGCCMENKIALLVFEFVPNGTLLEHLQGKREGFSPLTWRQRLLIALHTSDALAYLHSAADPPIFHRDVKSSNILLDDDLNAKVADFGISKLAPNNAATHVSTVAVQGTMGYIDPEYYVSFQLTPKSDVYSFGVVLLELISAKPAVDFQRGYDETSLVNLAFSAMDRGSWEGLIDPVLADTFTLCGGKASIDSVGALAVRCLAIKSRDRPDMREVRNVLQTVWLHWDSDASDDVGHDLQAQHASSDVHGYPQQGSQLSQYSSSTISGSEIEMSSLISTW